MAQRNDRPAARRTKFGLQVRLPQLDLFSIIYLPELEEASPSRLFSKASNKRMTTGNEETSRLSPGFPINEVKDGDKTRYFVGNKGDVISGTQRAATLVRSSPRCWPPKPPL